MGAPAVEPADGGRTTRAVAGVEELIRVPDAPPEIIADQLSCRSEQVAVRKFRARRMLAEEIWTELKHTVSSTEDRDEERAELAPFLEHYVDREALENEESLT